MDDRIRLAESLGVSISIWEIGQVCEISGEEELIFNNRDWITSMISCNDDEINGSY